MRTHGVIAAIFSVLLLGSTCHSPGDQTNKGRLEEKHYPEDHFFAMRSWPDAAFDLKAYEKALKKAQKTYREQGHAIRAFDQAWEVRGPANFGGRINTIAVNPQDENHQLIGFARGGIWKTTNGGTDWSPVFDDNTYLAIGHITFAPSDPQIVYAGTGDPNISGYPGIGNGLFKSTDGGDSWTYIGLENQRIISRIAVHPDDPNTLYVACMGLPFERNSERGLYKSTDGGQSWEKILFVSEQAGIIDLIMHPNDPDILYAAGWDRIRNNQESLVSGSGARIYRTLDGGAHWEILDNGLPLANLGRIGLAIAASNPDVLYASYVGEDSELYNIYKTTNGGDSWEALFENGVLNGLPSNFLGAFGWYFGQIRVHPANENDIFILGVDLYRSTNGGANWTLAAPQWYFYEVHADKHDLVFTPSGSILLATDGGMNRSDDNALSWTDAERIPAVQLYRVAYNPHQPEWVYGGAQDNGTLGGTNVQSEWERFYGADGFQPAFRPDMPEVMYSETQRGGIRVSLTNGQSWQSGTNGIPGEDRRSWDMPYFISPNNPDVLYTGTYRVFKSEAGPVPSWFPVGPDLTDGIIYESSFHIISSVDESPLQTGLLYAGTSDGNAWRGINGGLEWINITEGLPDRYITSIKASPDSVEVVYISHSGYKDNDFIPHLHRSRDRGNTWENISGNLPELAVNDVLILPGHADSVLFAATDGGVYVTLNGGAYWERLGNNMPFVPVYDLDYSPERNELMAGTYARSIMTYSLTFLFENSPVVAFSAAGHARTNFGHELPGVQVQLNVSDQNFQSTSDDSGLFQLDGSLPVGQVYPLEIGREDDVRNGISTLDLILLHQHILGVQLLESPYQRIAADADHNGSITTLDLIAFRRLLLGLEMELPQPSWVFIRADYEFEFPENPFGEVYTGAAAMFFLNPLNTENLDIIGVKTGDLNGDAVLE